MSHAQHLILNEKQILQKIKRVAYEVYERNFQEKHLVIAGIADKGYMLAEMLMKVLQKIAPAIEWHLVKVLLDKKSSGQIKVALADYPTTLAQRSVILVDDVLNTGKTLAYSLPAFLNAPIKKLETFVLIHRNHHIFPISVDYVGYELSTTLHEYVEVALTPNRMGVYLG